MKSSDRAGNLRNTLYATISFLSLMAMTAGAARADEGSAAAADAVADAGSDIVVTGARAEVDRREPAIVTALGGDRIDTLGVQKVSDITGFVPGLFQPRTGITSSHSTIFVRGIGEITPQGRPAVPVYIDGIFIPRTAGANQDLLDVESIDVARGPQGFLFGHSAEGGAISIRTLTPDNDTRARIMLGYGSFNEIRAGAVVSSALVKDRLFASVAVQHRRRDGITKNLTTGRDDNNIETSSARAKLRWTPNDRLEIVNIVDGTIDHGDAKVWGDRKRSTDPDIAYSPIDPKNVYRQFGYTLQINYDLSDRLRWETVGGYRHYTYWTNYDNTGDTYGRGIGLLGYHENFYTAETRIVGEFPGLDFSIGAHFAREEFQRSGANNGNTTYTTDPNLSTFRPIWSVADQQYNNWALFGQATVAVTDALRVTVGGRLNYEKQFQQMSNYSLSPTPGQLVTGWQLDQELLYAASPYRRSTPPPDATLAWAVDVQKAFTRFTPKLALEYAVARDAKLYASFSQGTHEGGFDNGGLSPLASGATQASLPFSPEKVTTYEAGVRTAFADQAVRLNAAVFYNRFDNIQLSTLDPITNISRRFNAGTGRSWGVEGDLQVTPVAGLNLGVTASYLNAELTSVRNAPASTTFPNGLTLNTRPFVGARLPNAPRFQGQANIQYKVGGFGIGGDVQYRTSSFTDALSNDVNRIPRQTLANAFVSYDPTDNLTLRLDVRNLTDKRYPQALNYNQNGGTLMVYSATYNDPRSVFGSLTFRY